MSSAENLIHLELVRAKIVAVKNDVARGNVSAAGRDLTSAANESALIDAGTPEWHEAQALVAEGAALLRELQLSGEAEDRQHAAAVVDALVVQGVLERNADEDYRKAADDEVAAIRAATTAANKGWDADTAYAWGLDAAELEHALTHPAETLSSAASFAKVAAVVLVALLLVFLSRGVA